MLVDDQSWGELKAAWELGKPAAVQPSLEGSHSLVGVAASMDWPSREAFMVIGESMS